MQQQQQQSSKPSLQPYHLATMAPGGEQVQVHLSNATTWQKFSRQNTEMIVTKAGRRMFPCLCLDIAGLDPAKQYEVYVTLLLADQHTLKYQRGVWIPNGQAEVYPPPGCTAGLAYLHPDSPATGRHWTKQEVTFMRLKLTNKLEGFEDPSRNGAMIFAYSMHKYLPVVHISELPSAAAAAATVAKERQARFYTSVTFPGTEFITVTAYQNPELTDLKIQFNPYAKGVRNQADRVGGGGGGAFLIDTFRPARQTTQQQQQLLHHQRAAASPMEFGAYPNQTASAYGHWQHQHQHQQARRHLPYSVPASSSATSAVASDAAAAAAAAAASASAAAVSSRPTSKSPPAAEEAEATTPASSDAAAAGALPSAYYISPYLYQPPYHQYQQQQQQQQQQYQLHHYHQMQGQLYCTPPSGSASSASSYYYNQLLGQPDSVVKLESTGDYRQLHHQHHDHHHQQQQPPHDSPLSPASQQQQQPQLASLSSFQVEQLTATPVQQQQHQQQHPQQHLQSCSLLASNSHITDSSPSGISFNSPDLQ